MARRVGECLFKQYSRTHGYCGLLFEEVVEPTLAWNKRELFGISAQNVSKPTSP